MARRARALLALVGVCALLGSSGCGQDEGVADGATVHAYVVSTLCASAKQTLRKIGPQVGDLRVRIECVPWAWEANNLDLTVGGASARRVAEDSAAVVYAEPAGQANRYVPGIVEAAGIPVLLTSSGEIATERFLRAIGKAGDSGSLREGIAEALQAEALGTG